MQTFGQLNVNGSVEIGVNDEADLVRVATGIGDGEVIMPSAEAVLGKRYTIRRVSGGGSIYVLAASESGDTFDGAEDYTVTSNGPRRVTFQAVQTGASTYGWETLF